MQKFSLTETAAEARKSLKKAFPGQKFSVRSKAYSGGCSIDVSWTDGPTRSEVEAVVGHMHQCTFDSMTDLKEYTNSRYGADYIFCNRTISNEFYTELYAHLMTFIPAEFADRFVLKTEYGRTYINSYDNDAHTLIHRMVGASRPGRLAMPEPFGDISIIVVDEPTPVVEVAAEVTEEAPATEPVAVGEYTVSHDRDWTWIDFGGAAPSAEVMTALKTAHKETWFSKRRQAVFIKATVAEEEIARLLGSNVPATEQLETADQPDIVEPQPEPTTPAIVERLRNKADALQAQIDKKMNPACGDWSRTNYTHRRANMAESSRRDGERIQRTQTMMRALADLHEAGVCPPEVAGVDSKAMIETILTRNYDYIARNEPEMMPRLRKAGMYSRADFMTARAILEKLTESYATQMKAERERRELADKVRSLVGIIPGYFPTPTPIIDQMLSLVSVQPSEKVAEPNAGDGAIARALRERGVEPDCWEWSSTLAAYLSAQGFAVKGNDCLTANGNGYDVIAMNPPFENGQDVDHIRHAFDKMLAPNGRLVAIASEGPFFRSDAKSVAFREWLDTVGYSIELEAGAFAISGTGVKTRIVYAEK